MVFGPLLGNPGDGPVLSVSYSWCNLQAHNLQVEMRSESILRARLDAAV